MNEAIVVNIDSVILTQLAEALAGFKAAKGKKDDAYIEVRGGQIRLSTLADGGAMEYRAGQGLPDVPAYMLSIKTAISIFKTAAAINKKGVIDVLFYENRLEIWAGSSMYGIPAVKKDESIEVEPSGEVVARYTITGQFAKNAIGYVLPFTSTDSRRTYLQGVNIHIEGDAVKLVATDSFRLALRLFGTLKAQGVNHDVIINGDIMRAMLKFLGKKPNGAIIQFRHYKTNSGHSVYIENGKWKVLAFGDSRGKFPDFQGLLTSINSSPAIYTATYNNSDLYEATAGMIKVAPKMEKYRAKVTFDKGNTTFSLKGEGEAVLASAAVKHRSTLDESEHNLVINAAYIRDAMQQEGETIVEYRSDRTAVIFRAAGTTAAIMPITG